MGYCDREANTCQEVDVILIYPRAWKSRRIIYPVFDVIFNSSHIFVILVTNMIITICSHTPAPMRRLAILNTHLGFRVWLY